MTRQEEIDKAFEKALPATEGYTPFYCEKVAFRLGAEWADENQKSPWISVKDDLPCNHEDYILDVDSTMPKTRKVLAYNKKGNVKETFMINVGGKRGWVWDLSADTIPLYWMFIPELPK